MSIHLKTINLRDDSYDIYWKGARLYAKNQKEEIVDVSCDCPNALLSKVDNARKILENSYAHLSFGQITFQGRLKGGTKDSEDYYSALHLFELAQHALDVGMKNKAIEFLKLARDKAKEIIDRDSAPYYCMKAGELFRNARDQLERLVINDEEKKEERNILREILDSSDVERSFLDAAKKKDQKLIQELISQGHDINATTIAYKQTALLEAARDNNLDAVKSLIEGKADVNAKDDNGETSFDLAESFEIRKILQIAGAAINAGKFFVSAVKTGRLECVQYLLAQRLDPNSRGWCGDTALHEAARRGHLEIIKCLIEGKADINAINDSRHSPFQSAKSYEIQKKLYFLGAPINKALLLFYAAKEGNSKRVQELLTQGLDINFKDENGRTALHYAASSNDLDAVKCLIESKADVNAKNHEGGTPSGATDNFEILKIFQASGSTLDSAALFHSAVKERNLGGIQKLIEGGHNINASDKEGRTALHYAAFSDDLDAAKCLIAAKADVNAKDLDGESPYDKVSSPLLEYLKFKRKEKQEMRNILRKAGGIPGKKLYEKRGWDWDFYEAIEKKDFDFAEDLLAHGYRVDCRHKENYTVLHRAASLNDLEGTKWLIKNKADINAIGYDEKTPFDLTEKYEIKKILHDAGAAIDPGSFFASAVETGRRECVEYLLAQRLNPNSEYWGKRPLHRAAENGYSDIAKCLIDGKADVNARGGILKETPYDRARAYPCDEHQPRVIEGKKKIRKMLKEAGGRPSKESCCTVM